MEKEKRKEREKEHAHTSFFTSKPVYTNKPFKARGYEKGEVKVFAPPFSFTSPEFNSRSEPVCTHIPKVHSSFT
jgi:hypothetical protein